MSFSLLLRAALKRAGAPDAFRPFALECEMGAAGPAHLERYNAMFGFAPGSLPVTYYYLVAQRAQLAAMLERAFPFRIVGMVHVENALTEHARWEMSKPLRVTTEVRLEAPSASGTRFCVLVTTAADDSGPVFSCTSKYLALRGRAGQGKTPGAPAAPAAAGAPVGEWRVPASAGRAYASISGDWNPIHLAGWTARLMGMRAPIIHGMHSVATACGKLEAAQGRRVTGLSARFTAAVPLGAQVRMAADGAAGAYTLACGGKTAVEGNYTLA